MAASENLPPGAIAPLAGSSPSDHSGWIVIANGIGLCLALVALGVRLIVRKHISLPSKLDDVMAWIATAFGMIQACLVFKQVSSGYGKTIKMISNQDIEEVQKIGYSADPLYLLTIYLAKISMIYLLARITPEAKQHLLLKAGIAVCVTLSAISIALILTRCTLSRPWLQYGERCEGLFLRWQVIAAFDIATEITLFIIPVSFLFGLRMKLNHKAKVVFAFGLRLPIIAISILRLRELRNQINSEDPTLIGALATVWTQVSMHYSLIATTLPCVNPFLSKVNTNFGALELQTMTGTTAVSTNDSSEDGLKAKRSPIETISLQTFDGSVESRARPNFRDSNMRRHVFSSRHSLQSSESTEAIAPNIST